MMRSMVVVISDLHFEEERGDIIGDPASPNCIRFNRNVPASAFEDMMCDVANMAKSNGANQLDFILAGDVFDLHRTQLWFGEDEDIRPYVDCNDVKPGSVLETKLLSILNAIVSEDAVKESLEVFHRFSGGQYLDTSDGNRTIKDFGLKTFLHFLPGNHDRLTNATPAIRTRVRKILGLEGGDTKFGHQFNFTDPPVLVRHGHEYDPTNFPIDLSGKFISSSLPDDLYDKANIRRFCHRYDRFSAACLFSAAIHRRRDFERHSFGSYLLPHSRI